MSEVKQVVVIRRDLKMRRGKEIAQGAHAAMAFLAQRLMWVNSPEKVGTAVAGFTGVERLWLTESHRKVTVYVNSEAELRDLEAAAKAAGVEAHLITDAGFTEFAGVPIVTALGLGPDYDTKLDPITGHLPLY